MLPIIYTQEDKNFFLAQRELRRCGAMTGVDNILLPKWTRERPRGTLQKPSGMTEIEHIARRWWWDWHSNPPRQTLHQTTPMQQEVSWHHKGEEWISLHRMCCHFLIVQRPSIKMQLGQSLLWLGQKIQDLIINRSSLQRFWSVKCVKKLKIGRVLLKHPQFQHWDEKLRNDLTG